MKRKYLYYILPLVGVLFCLWYLQQAVCDVIYTDYIRIVNDYLPDVWSGERFFVPDLLTRIPVNYLARIINTTWFGYSTFFDMILGVLGLGFSGWVFGRYCSIRQLAFSWYILLMIVLFSLNKWEMLTNGTGWVHFWAVGSFFYHFLVLDRVVSGIERKYDQLRLLFLPFIITLGVAGPYCASYTVVLALTYVTYYLTHRKSASFIAQKYINYLICLIVPFFCYLWSNFYAVEDHAETVSMGIGEMVSRMPLFPLRFLLKSMSSILVGMEQQVQKLNWTGMLICVVGLVVLLCYLFALWLNIRYRLYRKTIFPSLCLVMGCLNHGLIFVSRWIFLRDYYGMSSRYTLQYQIGVLGIILTMGLLWRELQDKVMKMIAVAIALAFLGGNGFTTYDEIKKAPFRKAYSLNIQATALDFEMIDDETLRERFDYRKKEPDSGKKVRNALEILKRNNWNVFRD